MKIDAYMKLDNPLGATVKSHGENQEITPDTMQELRNMEQTYKQNYVERKVNM
jgi:hypothetical protein